MGNTSSPNPLRIAIRGVVGLFAILALTSPALAAPSSPIEPRNYAKEITLATKGTGDFPGYRIVALTSLPGGIVLASYDGRPDGGDAPSPNSIVQRRSTDAGETWGPQTYISKGQVGSSSLQKYGFSDPSYVVDQKTGKVFNFHVFSKNQGFLGSVLGNDDANLNVLSAQVSVSTDKGISWSTDPTHQTSLPPSASSLITKSIKPVGTTVNGVANVGGVVGAFASSGEGIQLRYGPHAGRLIQQFAGKVIQPDGSKINQAYSVYSDDSGATWKMGTPVGRGMDENKVVELSNGDVMLNSRPGDGTRYRIVAISKDGGVTYGTPWSETQLPDPVNNAGFTRMYPDAPQGSAEAKILLFTNAANTSARNLGKIRFSCDDGKTWSAGRAFHSSDMSYSTVTPLGNDMFGIFYEGNNGDMTFAKVDKEWIGVNC
ncbi:uncharacterized protein DNG_04308 [Cephalotrichum gorgonifer]|uniref:Sialidase domain-containing protein n=1 Tax=Cephalotrichum gorgonifer TaxID=2041049 RepID=A0AAE8SUF0_9PEZI|nr:uncharacterized protein DNG_04308 [Cephalotrichum gorgonifer]